MNIIVIGGCHSYSFGLDNKDLGYTFLLSKNNIVDILAPVTNKSALHFFTDNSDEIKKYDIIILQLGNHEYSISFKKIFKNIFGKDSNNIKSAIVSEKKIDEYRQKYTNSAKNNIIYDSVLYYILKILLSVCKFRFLKENKKIIKEIINQARKYKIIVITPFPVKYRYLNLFRKIGQKVFLDICIKENIPYIDTNYLFLKKDYVLLEDGFHLNKEGHLYIYEKILDVINNNNKS